MSKRKEGNDGEISATVEETNKMRKAMGMKPLEEGSSSSKKKEVWIHDKKPKDDKPSEDDVKKRVAAAKNRRDHEELTKGKGLGDILAEEEGGGGATDWVTRTRKDDGSMKQPAGAKADKSGKKKEAATAAAEVPKSVKVRHNASDIQEGETIMTLSDKKILDDAGEIEDTPDELSNVRMTDHERQKHNDALKNQVEYDPHKEGADVLDKYDELKTGPKGFMLGGVACGVIEETDPEKRLAILTTLSEKHTLEQKTKVQSDYLTAEEMNSFRKPKKKLKKRARQAGETKDPENQLPVAKASAARSQDVGSDEEDPELYEQLSKQRRLVRRSEAGNVKKGEEALSAVSERVQSVEEKDDKDDVDINPAAKKEGENMAMTATTEFCNVVQTPIEKMDTMKHESFRGSTLYKQQATQRRAKAVGPGGRKWAAAVEEEAAADKGQEDDEHTLMEDGLDMSICSGLAYLRARSQIGNDQESHRNRKSDNRPLEMSTVDGDIKLEYRDDYGRVQTPKEAFRAISWKFHGKVPGRKNLERRLSRLENEMRLKSMNPVEQLPTLRALRHVQHADAKPYMVLSGANEK